MRSWMTKEARLVLEWARTPEIKGPKWTKLQIGSVVLLARSSSSCVESYPRVKGRGGKAEVGTGRGRSPKKRN